MKTFNFLLISLVFSATNAVAGIPDGYYSSADGLKSTELKDALMNIIGTHKTISYSSLWDYYPYTYYHIGEEERVYDMYSAVVTYFSDYSNMNKEHVVPKSWWGGSTATGAGCDLYNVIPGEAAANNAKSNYPLGETTAEKATYDNGVIRVGPAEMEDYSGTVFEPADVNKGDFARIYLYVATCYPDFPWDDNNADAMTNGSSLTLKTWIAPMLVAWNAADPVDEAEIQRNEDISKYQQNRNPFIDYPELADYIWGDKTDEPFYFSLHTANEGSSNDNMKTKSPTFSTDYGTAESPKEVAEGTEITIQAGSTYATLFTRVNGGEWEETNYTTGYNSSSNASYVVNAKKTISISGDMCIEAYCSQSGYADSNTVTAYYTSTDFDSIYLLYEAFDDASSGNNTSTSGSSTKWEGNNNFPTVSTVYCAGNTLRMGSGSASGSITSRRLDTQGGQITVELDVKGWSKIEGDLVITVSEMEETGDDDAEPALTELQSATIAYTAIMTDEFEHQSVTFEDVCAYPVITIATTAKRAFVDNIVVYGEDDSNTTAIQETPNGAAKTSSSAAYNLAGQRTDSGAKGIIIRNGRKILVK